MSDAPLEYAGGRQLSTTHRLASALLVVARWVAVLLGAVATLWWIAAFEERSGWAAVLFLCYVAPAVGLGSLLFGALPAALLWWSGRSRRDRRTLLVTASVFVVMAVEVGTLLGSARLAG